MAFGSDFLGKFQSFLTQAPSSFHASVAAGQELQAAGFTPLDEADSWPTEPGGYFCRRGGAIIAWYLPENITAGFRIVGSHTDSPGFKLKARPRLQQAHWEQANVEIYGGPIVASWFDRELLLAGEVVLRDGTSKLIHTDPVLRIPHLAIHLDRSQNDGLKIDRQRQVQPIVATVDTGCTIYDVLATAADVDFQEITAFDLITTPAQAPTVFGANQDMLAAARLDNLSSVYPSLMALLQAAAREPVTGHIPVFAAFDHEEVGSASPTGAAGPFLAQALERVSAMAGFDRLGFQQLLSQSSCISADAAHSVHPNYSERHDPENYPLLGRGPALKINANQRYATTAPTAALWHRACEAAGFESQVFVGNNSVPCGSTIGPITATRLGIPVVDVGIPLLSMHSARELAGVDDLRMLYDACYAYLVG
ncbi:MAG: M18 family aminopeptidase [Corynebacterium sp.]|nr:M18 family aminopeptidase [Corynebacterium sp.]